MDMIFWLTSLKGVLDFRDWEEKNLDSQREKRYEEKGKERGKRFFFVCPKNLGLVRICILALL